MACEVEWIPLGDIVNISSGGTPDKKQTEYWNGEIPWISAKTLTGDTVTTSNNFITKKGLQEGSKLAPVDSILLLTRGSGLFKRIPLAIVGAPVAYNQDVKCLTSKVATISNRYVFYVLKAQSSVLSNMLETTGIGAGKLATDRLLGMPIPVLSCDVRDKVESFFSVLSRKIELIDQLNDYLVELLDALFAKALEETSDWSEATLLDIANYKNGLAMQKFRPEGNDPGLPVLKIKELGQGTCSADSERCRSDIDEAVHIYDGDLVFSWSGTLLLDFWAGGDAGLNQHLFKVTSEEYPTWFYYAWTKYHMRKFVALAKDRATTMGHIKRSALAEAKVLIPPSKAFGKLNSQMQPIVDQMINLKVEARKLGEFRDSLLPKLMSGEIDVSKIDLMQPANNHLADC